MPPLLPLLLAAALPALAVRVPGHEDPAAALARSRRDPGRLHALIVSATWCHACKNLKAALEGYQPSSGPVAAAAWSMTEIDRLPEKALSKLLRDEGGDAGGTLPAVVALRGGRPLGYSVVGADLGGIERFLADAAARPDGAAASRPRLTCPGAREWASYTLGVSGYLSEDDSRTDWFGREVLLSFRGERSRSPARLLAPARVSSTTLAASPSGTGVFFAPDPSLDFAGLFGPVEESLGAVSGLAESPGSRLRLILTGHGAPEGMSVAYEAYADTGPFALFSSLKKYVRLDEPLVSSAVASARRAGKEVRALVTACYGGQFGPAFMPLRGAAPACAAFATLPEKTAEGCYADAAAKREDYVASAAKALACPAAPGGSRARHYQAVAQSSGRDVPMLSSEYFLLYGPGAAFLGSRDRAPAPPGGLLLRRYPGGVEVVFDLVAGGVAAARRGKTVLPPPRVSIIGCQEDLALVEPSNLFFLRARAAGPEPRRNASCVPELALEWDRGAPSAPARLLARLKAESMDGDAVRYDPSSDMEWTKRTNREVEAALPGPPTVDARGLKTEARAWLAAVWPRFARPLPGASLRRELSELAAETRGRDPDLAGAIVALAERARAEALLAMSKWSPAFPEEKRLRESMKELGREQPSPDPDEGLTGEKLAAAMLGNLGPREVREDDVTLARLAHVVSVAAAESVLRERARSSSKARALAAQLDALKLCERGVLD